MIGSSVKVNWPLAVLLGAVSGAAYGFWQTVALERLDSDMEVVAGISRVSAYGGAGVFYGLIVLGVLHRGLRLGTARWLILTVLCAACYYAAVYLAVSLYEPLGKLEIHNFLSGGAAGALGGGLFALATLLLYRPARSWQGFALPLIAGSVVGLGLPLALESEGPGPWIAFFAAWQALYAGAFALALRRD